MSISLSIFLVSSEIEPVGSLQPYNTNPSGRPGSDALLLWDVNMPMVGANYKSKKEDACALQYGLGFV